MRPRGSSSIPKPNRRRRARDDVRGNDTCQSLGMTDKRSPADVDTGNMEKNPTNGVAGDEPMTDAQKAYLRTLSEEAHVDFDETLSTAGASKRIDELQRMTGRGLAGDASAKFVPNDPHVGEDGDHATLSIGPG